MAGELTTERAQRRGTLTETVIEQLVARIESGTYASGEKLPTEQDLCKEFGVSRTVIREAVASLRLGGLLIARQGIGVFVPLGEKRRLKFEVKPGDDLQSALKILELRLAVETEAAALAAVRRTPKHLSEITAAFDRFNELDGSKQLELAEADLAFHLAIARATGNSYFPDLLGALGPDIIFDLDLKHDRLADQSSRRSYVRRNGKQHGAILSAISQGNAIAARRALKRHLDEGLTRYRRLIGKGGLG